MAEFVKGEQIVSMDQLMKSQLIFYDDNVLVERSVWDKWKLEYADGLIRGGQLYKARRKQEQTADRDYMSTESVARRYIHNLEKRVESHKKAIDALEKTKEFFEKIQEITRENRE